MHLSQSALVFVLYIMGDVSGIFCLCSFAIISSASSQLSWSRTYTLKAVLRIPSADIEEPYQIWVDGDTGNSRIDFYDGLDKLYKIRTPWEELQYFKIRPESVDNKPSRNVCKKYAASEYLVRVYTKENYLPEHNFKHIGFENIENFRASKWEYVVKNIREGFNIEFKYTIWIKSDSTVNIPVRYEYHSTVNGREMDYFRHDYAYFDTAKPDPHIFEIPSSVVCNIATVPLHEPLDPLMEYVYPAFEDKRASKAFDSFKLQHNKTYRDNTEHHERMFVFKNNLRFINSVNRQHKSYSLAVNQFADLNSAELSRLNALQVAPLDYSKYEKDDSNDDDNMIGDNDISLDWRVYNAISPVKDQTHMCGSCYAFTAAATVESTSYIYSGCKKRHFIELSEQAIIDCTWKTPSNGGNSGCESGDLYFTLSKIKQYGVPTNDTYGPYLAMEGICRSKDAGKKFKISKFDRVKPNETAIKKKLKENGPLAIALNGNPRTFLYYSKGIYDDVACRNTMDDLSHGVTLIGFGEEAGQEYWILKNSYGTQWGENGFMRIAIKNNVCGVMNLVFSVQFKKKNQIRKCFERT